MICKHCGREIPDDAVLCSYCGKKIQDDISINKENVIDKNEIILDKNENIFDQNIFDQNKNMFGRPNNGTSPNTAAPKANSTPPNTVAPEMNSTPASSGNKPEKRKSWKKLLTAAIIGIAAYFVGSGLGHLVGSNMSKKDAKKESQISVTTEATTEAASTQEESSQSSDAAATTASEQNNNTEAYFDVFCGALYQNGVLTYGPVSVPLDNFSLYTPEDDDSKDYLVNSDGSSVVYVGRNFEVNVSYDKSDEEAMLKSYEDNDSYSNISILYFDKLNIGDYPCIRYGVKLTVNGQEEYVNEIIVMESKQPDSTLRITTESTDEAAYDHITECFKETTLNPVPLTTDDTEKMGISKITVK